MNATTVVYLNAHHINGLADSVPPGAKMGQLAIHEYQDIGLASATGSPPKARKTHE